MTGNGRAGGGRRGSPGSRHAFRVDPDDVPPTRGGRGPHALRTDGSGAGRELDRLFDALSHPYRRRILLLLSEDNPRDEDEFAVEDLATEEDELELLTSELYHAHLPKLAESGYIEWDRDANSIRRGPNYDAIAPLLRLMRDHADELPGGWP